jgi:hypothetical protein
MAKGTRQQESGSRYQVLDFPNPIFDTTLDPWPFAVIIYPTPTSAKKTNIKDFKKTRLFDFLLFTTGFLHRSAIGQFFNIKEKNHTGKSQFETCTYHYSHKDTPPGSHCVSASFTGNEFADQCSHKRTDE